jgi:hypothetical protein
MAGTITVCFNDGFTRRKFTHVRENTLVCDFMNDTLKLSASKWLLKVTVKRLCRARELQFYVDDVGDTTVSFILGDLQPFTTPVTALHMSRLQGGDIDLPTVDDIGGPIWKV